MSTAPVSRELARHLEQPIGFGVGEHGRRLVEEEHLRVGVEPEQFEPLAFTDRHRRHSGGRVDVEAESLGERSEVDRRPGSRRPPGSLGPEQQEVVDGHHRRHEAEVLLHGDATFDGLPR